MAQSRQSQSCAASKGVAGVVLPFPPLSWWLATIDEAAGSGDHLETQFNDGCQFSIIDGRLPFLYVSRKETMHTGKLRKWTGKKQKSDMKFCYPLIV